MDIATLLAPGTAVPVESAAVPAAGATAIPGVAFADLFADAMDAAAPAVESIDPGINGLAELPDGSCPVAPPELPDGNCPVAPAGLPDGNCPVAPSELPDESGTVAPPEMFRQDEPAPIDGEGEAFEVAKATPRRRPILKGFDPEAVKEPHRVRGVKPPETPPVCPTAPTPQEAAIEAPNAPAQKPDQEDEEAFAQKPAASAPIPAPVVATPGGPATPVAADATKPPVDPKQAVAVKSVAAPDASAVPAKASKSFSKTTPILTKDDDASASLGVTPEPQAFAGVFSDETAPNVDAPAIAAPALEAAPDLGIVPTVVVDAAPTPAPTLTPISQKVAPLVDDKAATSEKAVAAPSTKTVETSAPEATAPESKAEKADIAEPKAADALTDLDVAEKTASGSGGASQGDGTPQDGSPQDGATQAAAPTIRTAATERPEAGDARPAVDRHLVVRQVADRIENLVAARPRDGVTIHLEPRDLGTVTLVVKGLASALDVQMFASDERVRQSLDASRPELAQALAPRHIEVREIRVSAAPSAPSGAASGDAGTNPDGRPRQQPPTPQQAFAHASPRAQKAAVRLARRDRGVDLLV